MTVLIASIIVGCLIGIAAGGIVILVAGRIQRPNAIGVELDQGGTLLVASGMITDVSGPMDLPGTRSGTNLKEVGTYRLVTILAGTNHRQVITFASPITAYEFIESGSRVTAIVTGSVRAVVRNDPPDDTFPLGYIVPSEVLKQLEKEF
jgi:hypothetical protein